MKPITTGLERTAAVCERISAEIDAERAELSPAERRERAYADREERLNDALRPMDWHTPYHARFGETCELECDCTATKTADGWQWDNTITCPEHNPRGPIETYYDHGHWHALRRDHYDGAPDSGINGCLGTSQRTKAEAIDELLECEDAHEEMRAAREAA